jgi:hypothetical protein
MSPDFMDLWNGLLGQLETNPKQFSKKHGKLKSARAAPLQYGGAAYRVLFTLDEGQRELRILACDLHDRAYAKATRRITERTAR